MRSLLRPLLTAALLVAGSCLEPGASIAGGPPAPQASSLVPGPDAAGPIRLPSGRLLPVPPTGAERPSEMAAELAAHASDHISFTPGAVPRPLAAPIVLSGAPAAGSGSGDGTPSGPGAAELIPLAPKGGTAAATLTALPNGLRKEVFGFLPYWALDATDLQWMQYGLVSTIAYFGVAARSDGSLATSSGGVTTTTWAGWNSSAMTSVINAAHAKGDRVVMTITMMAWDSASAAAQATLLGSATYRSRLISNIISTLRARHADGVNLDFEPVGSTLRSQYTSFVRQLKAALVAAGVGSYLTVCTTAGAATWATGYDVAALTASGAADALFVMGYDYSWSGSSRAGGVAPMSSPYMLDVNDSVNDFLSLTSGARLIWGVPYYGRTWYTTSSALNAYTVSGASGSSKAYGYTGAKALAAKYGRKWDGVGLVPWFTYYDSAAGHYVEGYYDDTASLGTKYDMINRRGLGGVGIWHLLMDASASELWNLIANRFQKDTIPPGGGITSLPATTDSYAINVTWRAIDVGSGVASYTVQVRDRASATWTTWLSGTTAGGGTWIGTPGHAYEFRVSARDKLGNAQPWVAAMGSPGSSLALGGFASVAVATLNVRSGAGTGFTALDQLSQGDRVAVISGPIAADGYQWYQVQFAFAEWPSADYPRTGWAAAGDGTSAYLVPAVAPTVTTVAPAVSGYALGARAFSPNGDGRSDGVSVSYTLGATGSVTLDVLNAAGAVVDSTSLGSQPSGDDVATWDGRLSSGAWAAAGSYLLRVTSVDASGTHQAPAAGVNGTILAAWGVTADLTPPQVASYAPTAPYMPTSTQPVATFSEPVTGVDGSSVNLTDVTAGTPVAATISYSAGSRTVTVLPAAALAPSHTFRVSLGGSIRDGVGNLITPATWTFGTTTGPVILYSPLRTLSFGAGTTVGYRFDATGKVIGSRSYTLTKSSSASTSQRSKAIPAHPGAWFYVTNGIWAGYWIAESTRVYLPGISEQVTYSPNRTVSFNAGSYTGYRFWSTWTVSASRTYTLARASSASTNHWAVINGHPYAYIVNGVWAGYWMPIGGGVTLR